VFPRKEGGMQVILLTSGILIENPLQERPARKTAKSCLDTVIVLWPKPSPLTTKKVYFENNRIR
jgi:hypothetical protein